MEFYGEDLAAVHTEGFEVLAEAAAATLLRLMPPSCAERPILDLGCGAGPLSRILADRGLATWGLDISPALIGLARARLPGAEFHCGSLLDIALPTATAAAAAGEVLNYATANDPAMLEGIFRRLAGAIAPGGIVLFDLAAPGRGAVGRRFREGRGWAVGSISDEADGMLVRRITIFRETPEGTWRRRYEEHRLRLWTFADAAQVAGACGFALASIDGYDGLAMPPALNVCLATRLR